MSHGIMSTDALALQRRYGLPWHFDDTGEARDHDGTLAQILAVAKFSEHEGEMVPLYFADGKPSKFHSVRSVAHGIEYQAVTSEYTVPSYARSLEEFGHAIETAIGGPIDWDTAGTLFNGGRAFLCGRLNGSQYNVIHRDGRSQGEQVYIVAQLALDGQIARRVFVTRVRAVCNNTLTYGAASAIGDVDSSMTLSVKNTTNADENWSVRLGTLKQTITLEAERSETIARLAMAPMGASDASDYFADVLTSMVAERDRRDVVDTLLGSHVGYKQRSEIVSELLDNAERKPSERVETSAAAHGLHARTANLWARRHERLMGLYATGAGNAGDDAYDAFCAVTDFVDHDGARDYRGNAREVAEKRTAAALYGEGANLKQRAYDMLTERVLVTA